MSEDDKGQIGALQALLVDSLSAHADSESKHVRYRQVHQRILYGVLTVFVSVFSGYEFVLKPPIDKDQIEANTKLAELNSAKTDLLGRLLVEVQVLTVESNAYNISVIRDGDKAVKPQSLVKAEAVLVDRRRRLEVGELFAGISPK